MLGTGERIGPSREYQTAGGGSFSAWCRRRNTTCSTQWRSKRRDPLLSAEHLWSSRYKVLQAPCGSTHTHSRHTECSRSQNAEQMPGSIKSGGKYQIITSSKTWVELQLHRLTSPLWWRHHHKLNREQIYYDICYDALWCSIFWEWIFPRRRLLHAGYYRWRDVLFYLQLTVVFTLHISLFILSFRCTEEGCLP